LGVSSGILASLAAVGFSPEVLVQFGGVAAIGSILGTHATWKNSQTLLTAQV
jgi:NAD(P) transhydrogenase